MKRRITRATKVALKPAAWTEEGLKGLDAEDRGIIMAARRLFERLGRNPTAWEIFQETRRDQ